MADTDSTRLTDPSQLTRAHFGFPEDDESGADEPIEARSADDAPAADAADSDAGDPPAEAVSPPARRLKRVTNRDLCDDLVIAGLAATAEEAFEKIIIAFIKEQNPDRDVSAIRLSTQAQKVVIDHVARLIEEAAAQPNTDAATDEPDAGTDSDIMDKELTDEEAIEGVQTIDDARRRLLELISDQSLQACRRGLQINTRASKAVYPFSSWTLEDKDAVAVSKGLPMLLAKIIYWVGAAIGVEPTEMWNHVDNLDDDEDVQKKAREKSWRKSWPVRTAFHLLRADDFGEAVADLWWPRTSPSGSRDRTSDTRPKVEHPDPTAPQPLFRRPAAPAKSDEAPSTTESVQDKVKTVQSRAEAEDAISEVAHSWVGNYRRAQSLAGKPAAELSRSQKKAAFQARSRLHRLARLLVEYGVQLGCDRADLGDPEGDTSEWCVGASHSILRSPAGFFRKNIKALEWPGLPAEHQRPAKDRGSNKRAADRREESSHDASDDDYAVKEAARPEPRPGSRKVIGGGRVASASPAPDPTPTPEPDPVATEVPVESDRSPRDIEDRAAQFTREGGMTFDEIMAKSRSGA